MDKMFLKLSAGFINLSHVAFVNVTSADRLVVHFAIPDSQEHYAAEGTIYSTGHYREPYTGEDAKTILAALESQVGGLNGDFSSPGSYGQKPT